VNRATSGRTLKRAQQMTDAGARELGADRLGHVGSTRPAGKQACARRGFVAKHPP